MEAGVEDFSFAEGAEDIIEIRCDGNQMYSIKKQLEEAGLVNLVADFVYTPKRLSKIDEDESKTQFAKLVANIEGLEEYVDLVHNAELEDA